MSDNLPHTAQPASTKFIGALSLQNPFIIDSSNTFEGGSGGNFEEESGKYSDGVFSLGFYRTLFFSNFATSTDI